MPLGLGYRYPSRVKAWVLPWPLLDMGRLMLLEAGLFNLTIWWPEPAATYILGRVCMPCVEPAYFIP